MATSVGAWVGAESGRVEPMLTPRRCAKMRKRQQVVSTDYATRGKVTCTGV